MKQNNKLNELVKDFNNSEDVAKEILSLKKNTKTKVKIDEEIKGNYYTFFNDTIYLSKKSMEGYNKFIVISHEIIHSIQSKKLQLINFILSNLEILFTLIILAIFLFNKINNIVLMIYIVICVLNLIFRYILEKDAIENSVFLAKEYLELKIKKEDVKLIVEEYKLNIKKNKPLFYISLFSFKLIKMGLVVLLIIM